MTRRAPEELLRYVDMWALPGVHPTNVDFLKQLKTADTQQFTKNMQVVGTVSELDSKSRQWERTHLVGVRTDVWRADPGELARSLRMMKKKRLSELKQRIKRTGRLNPQQSNLLDERIGQDTIMQTQTTEIEKRRLVLKLFKTTGQRIRWCGTIEEVTTVEVHNSIGSRRCLLTMAVTMPETEYLTYVQENHRTFRVPSIFTFCYFDHKRIWHVSLKRRWCSIGTDFDVVTGNKPIGKLDGNLFSFASDSYVKLDAHRLAKNTPFVDLLTLFTSSVGYHRAMRRSLKRRVQAARSGESHRHVIDDQELRLHHKGHVAA